MPSTAANGAFFSREAGISTMIGYDDFSSPRETSSHFEDDTSPSKSNSSFGCYTGCSGGLSNLYYSGGVRSPARSSSTAKDFGVMIFSVAVELC